MANRYSYIIEPFAYQILVFVLSSDRETFVYLSIEQTTSSALVVIPWNGGEQSNEDYYFNFSKYLMATKG